MHLVPLHNARISLTGGIAVIQVISARGVKSGADTSGSSTASHCKSRVDASEAGTAGKRIIYLAMSAGVSCNSQKLVLTVVAIGKATPVERRRKLYILSPTKLFHHKIWRWSFGGTRGDACSRHEAHGSCHGSGPWHRTGHGKGYRGEGEEAQHYGQNRLRCHCSSTGRYTSQSLAMRVSLVLTNGRMEEEIEAASVGRASRKYAPWPQFGLRSLNPRLERVDVGGG